MDKTRIPPNPIKARREHLHLTQKELAELAGVTPQRVLREEQYLYNAPSDSIIRALSDSPTTQQELIKEYMVKRQKLHLDFSNDLCTSPFYQEMLGHALDYAIDYWDALSELRSPVRLFREQLFDHYGLPTSAVKFSVFTGMHPGTLSDIETAKTDWSGAPALVNVLRHNLLMSAKHIQQLGLLHDQYFMRKI